jgi:hypothetical protein
MKNVLIVADVCNRTIGLREIVVDVSQRFAETPSGRGSATCLPLIAVLDMTSPVSATQFALC